MPDIGGAAGAQSLGVARGYIEISTASAKNIASAMRGVGADVARSFGTIDAAVKRSEANLGRLSRGIGALRGELGAIALGAGVLNTIGLGAAAGFQEANIKLSGMTGGLANAQKLTAELRKQAAAAGIPFADMLNMATRLLPTLGGNTAELEKWYDVVKRTAVLNATEGISGAAFSINEAMSSGGTDLVSLVERFNISRVKLREALAANNGDFRLALDQVLNDMGITTAVAEQMGQSFNASFRVAKDAAIQFIAEGFMPLLELYTPLLQRGAQWLAQLRETNPAVAQVGAGLATAAAVGAPMLLLLNQLVEAGQRLKALGVLGALGRGGVYAAAGLLGANVGLGVGRAIGRATGDETAANATWSSLAETVKKLFFNIGWTLNKFAQMLTDAAAYVQNGFYQAVGGILSAVANLTRALAAMLPASMGRGAMMSAAGGMDAMAGISRAMGQQALDSAAQFRQRSNSQLLAAARGIMAQGNAGADEEAQRERERQAQVNAERDKAIREWAKRAGELERDAAEARLDATRQYEQQRAQTIADYERGILRDAEDFARQRARQAAQLERDINAIRADAVSRETKAAAELASSIAEIRAEGNERLRDLEKNYTRDREQAERDHRDRLLDAAARLDAVAVYNEQKRYRQQQTDAQTAYDERQATERQNMAERIAEEQRGHTERLHAAREADALRIAELRQSLADQQALEDEDRAIAAQRRDEDHQRQLAQMAQAQADRMAQIDQQVARERQALNESFTEQLNDLGTYQQAWRDLQAQQQAQSLAQFEDFWKAFKEQFPDPTQGPQTREQAGSAWPQSFADGGWVKRGGQAMIHAGEYVLNQRTAAAVAAAMGGTMSQAGIAQAVAGGSSINFEAVNVYAAPGQSPNDIAREVTRQIAAMLTSVGGGGDGV